MSRTRDPRAPAATNQEFPCVIEATGARARALPPPPILWRCIGCLGIADGRAQRRNAAARGSRLKSDARGAGRAASIARNLFAVWPIGIATGICSGRIFQRLAGYADVVTGIMYACKLGVMCFLLLGGGGIFDDGVVLFVWT